MNIASSLRNNSSNGGNSRGIILLQSEKTRFATPRGGIIPYSAVGPLIHTTTPPCHQHQDPQPEGYMTIRLSNKKCPGFKYCGTIEIEYEVPQGNTYHSLPGVGTHRVVVLPDNLEGRQLLIRYQMAWLRGRPLDNDSSVAGRKEHDLVQWKISPTSPRTSLRGDATDVDYIAKANAALNDLGIPSAGACLVLMSHANAPTHPPPPPPMMHHDPLEAAFSRRLHQNIRPPPAPKPKATATAAAPVPLLPRIAVARHGQKEMIVYKAPDTIPSDGVVFFSKALRPFQCGGGRDDDHEECAICLDTLSNNNGKVVVQLAGCGHAFHHDCIQGCLRKKPWCPVCRRRAGEPQGTSPSGTMSISVLALPKNTPGFYPKDKVIAILYKIDSGIQASYHERPGKRFSGTERDAYLPNNNEGHELLLRLKYAWAHGLTFRVGYSHSLRQHNQTLWGIPHQTTLKGAGPGGLYDDRPIDACHARLDALHVPSTQELLRQMPPSFVHSFYFHGAIGAPPPPPGMAPRLALIRQFVLKWRQRFLLHQQLQELHFRGDWTAWTDTNMKLAVPEISWKDFKASV